VTPPSPPGLSEWRWIAGIALGASRSTRRSCCSHLGGVRRSGENDRELRRERGGRQREGERARLRLCPAYSAAAGAAAAALPPFRRAVFPRSERGARHEQVTEDREGQTRGPPEVTEHRRTSVRIAAPASVLKPRPRFTVHDISGLCRGAAHFFAHPGPGGRTWRVKHGGGRALPAHLTVEEVARARARACE